MELEGEFAATKNLTLQGTFGLNDTKILSFFCSDCQLVYGNFSSKGNSLPSAPKYTWTFGGQYTGELSANYGWFARADYVHQGKYFVDYSNVAQGGAQEIVNARIGLTTDTMSLEGFVTNLTKESSPPSAVFGNDLFTFAGTNEIRYSLPQKRVIGMRARYNF